MSKIKLKESQYKYFIKLIAERKINSNNFENYLSKVLLTENEFGEFSLEPSGEDTAETDPLDASEPQDDMSAGSLSKSEFEGLVKAAYPKISSEDLERLFTELESQNPSSRK